MAAFPMLFFYPKCFDLYLVNLNDQVSTSYKSENKIEKSALHYMGLIKREDDQAFKEEPLADQGEDVDLVNVEKSIAQRTKYQWWQ